MIRYEKHLRLIYHFRYRKQQSRLFSDVAAEDGGHKKTEELNKEIFALRIQQ